MIANKVFPSFYLIDLEGTAANLEYILGADFNFRRVCIGSSDFQNDLLAFQAAEETINFLKSRLVLDGIKEVQLFNPEFYPNLAPLIVTEEMEEMEEAAEEELAHIERAGAAVGIILTRRFDEMGDFVSTKGLIENDTFAITTRVAVNPQLYLREKNIEKQEQLSRQFGILPTSSTPTSFH